ncbi:MAG: esterase-like activity of phytase family protein [Caulobacterales bacterium]
MKIDFRCVCLAAWALALSACAQTAPLEGGWRAIEVTASPAPLGAESVGQLRFLGGIELRSPSEMFGGISDIAVRPDGSFVAITDASVFIKGTLALDDHFAPTGVSDVEIAEMRDEDGRFFEYKALGDSEGLQLLPDGRALVSFEHHQVLRYYDLDHPEAASERGPTLQGASELPQNGGLEALAMFEDGRFLIGGEDTGTIWVADPNAEEDVPPQSRLNLPEGYGLVDFDRLPDGDFVALLRFYSPTIGVRIKVLRLSAGSLFAANGTARTSEIAHLQAPLALDNFEGVSAVQHDGRIVLYLASDDNFNARQRTLIYAFELREPR